MKKEIIIRIYVKSEKCQKNAMKEAAMISGVESVTLAGGDKNLLLVIGDGVDSSKLTKKLKKKVGTAEIVELRTLDTFEAAAMAVGNEMAMVARSPAYGGHWPPYYAAAPSPYAYHHHYHPSPMAAAGGGGSSYARVVALSHPANYSPLVEKHDYYPMDHRSSSGAAHKAAPRRSSSSSSTSYQSVPRRRRHDDDSSRCCIL